MNVLEQLLRAEALTYLLEVSRISGLVVTAPLSWVSAPARVRVGLVLALAFVAHGAGTAAPFQRAEPMAIALAVATELAIGVAMGFVVRVAVSIGEVAAEVIAPMMGLGAAHLFDPHAGSGTVLSTLLRHFTILLALVAGVHRVVLGGLVESFRLVPLGSSPALGSVAPQMVKLTADALASGLRIAIPIVAILFMVQVALAFISRAAPAIQVFSMGFAVTLGVGWISLIAISPDMTRRLLAEVGRVGDGLEGVLAPLGARPK